jgi:RecA/RadA recombinase
MAVAAGREAVERALQQRLAARGMSAALRVPEPPPRLAVGDAAATLDLLEREGPPPGAISEVAGAVGSGATSLAMRMTARAARVGQRIAWLDPQDAWDPDSAARAGVALEQVLWLRGHAGLRGLEGLSRWNEILGLLIQSGGFELMVADFLGWPLDELRRMPRSAWFRLLRGLERTRRDALVVLAPGPVAQRCARCTLQLGA